VKAFAFVFFLLLGAASAISADHRRLAFEQNDGVYIANLDVSVVRRLADGIFPAIAPDAMRIAFTSVEKSGMQYVRRIAITDVGSGKTEFCQNIPSDNCYYATWSPDGNSIAFTFRSDGVWHLGRVKADGSNFQFIKKGMPNQLTLYSPCWARDGLSIFCEDMTDIYRLNLDGSILARWKIGKIVPNGGMSGDGRIDVSPDGRRLLLSVEMDESYDRKNWDGPVPALWVFDLDRQIAVRLTSNRLFAWDGCWLDNEDILFVSQAEGEKQTTLNRMVANGKLPKQLLKGARHPSVSRP
jgi:TolB protein